MKQVVLLFLITAIFAFSVFAQNVKTKTPALLLGKKNYASFLESFETLNPIEKNGDILFSSGCLIHACGHLESAIAVDLVNNTIHAAIYNEEKKTRYFNEKGSETPEPITDWLIV